MNDLISRQAAIDAICNACGKIDCDKMDKCEKLQLPPANCSEFPNNSDTISRQAAIEVIDAVFPVDPMNSEYAQGIACGAALAKIYVEQLPSAQPEQPERCSDCEWWTNQPEIIRCKDCKHFRYDMPYVVQGIPVLGHEVCDFWGDGCKTNENGFCSFAERKESEGEG